MHDVGVQCILPHLHSNVKDAGLQCTLLCPVTTSSPLEYHPASIPQSESEILDIEGDKQTWLGYYRVYTFTRGQLIVSMSS